MIEGELDDSQSRSTMRAVRQNEVAVVGASAGGLVGALVAGFSALCCVGPSTVALLGVAGAVAAAGLEPYRLILLLVSFALLSYGFWRGYGLSAVSAGASCPVRVGRFARTVLWASGVIWLAAAIVPVVY